MLVIDRLHSDERGTTLVELMVGLAAGMVVLAALSMLMITTIRTTGRVSARVDATQRARVVLTNISEQLHSACIQPQMAPVLSKSTGTKLEFIHAASGTSSAVAPTPVKSVIWLNGETLEQQDFALVSGSVAKDWVFSGTGTPARKLLTKVTPLTPGKIFTYYMYSNGEQVALTPTSEGLAEAAKAVQVKVGLNALPSSQPVKDAGSDASLQTSAVLRLTPPTFSESAPALPCN